MADVTLDRPPRIADDGHGPAGAAREAEPSIDARAVRVTVGASTLLGDEPSVIVAPPPVPLAPRERSAAGAGLLGGLAPMPAPGAAVEAPGDALVVTDAAPAAGPTFVVDGEPTALRLVRRGDHRATLVVGEGSDAVAHRVVFTDRPLVGPDGVTRREVVVDGWRMEINLESERRAALRERARRGREAAAHGGPTEVKAIIPGLVVSVSVGPGDPVTAGQQILVVEAMKMQNELRAPRDGTVRKVGVAPGVNIEVGDLLLVIE
jgi:biotin carboxyl carrier protein